MQHFGEFFGPLMTFIVSGSLKWTIIGFSTQGGYFRALSIKIFEERCYMKLKFDAVNISDGPRQGDKRERSQKIRVVPPQVARFHIKLSVVVAPQRISQKGGREISCWRCFWDGDLTKAGVSSGYTPFYHTEDKKRGKWVFGLSSL